MDTPTGLTISGYGSLEDFFMFASFDELKAPTIEGVQSKKVEAKATIIQKSIKQPLDTTASTIEGRVKESTSDTQPIKVGERILI